MHQQAVEKMNAEKDTMKDEKVASLNQTLTSVENELMGRALDRRDDDLEVALDCITKAGEAGAIDVQYGDEAESDAGDDESESGEEEVSTDE